MPNYRVESCVIKYPEQIEQEWLDLQERADCSYFQSWGWIGTWLEQIAAGLNPLVVRVWYQDTLVGMGVLVPKRVSRHRIIRSDALFLNEYPFDGRNMVIEYNGLLADQRHHHAVYSETIRHVFGSQRHIDELFLGALSEREVQALPTTGRVKRLEQSPAWSVDLDRFGEGLDAYLATLSKNRRGQIRRSLRLYEEGTPLQLVEAGTREEALGYFEKLELLHTDRWRLKGLPGSFSNPRWEAFHRGMIQSRFGKGEIQLLRISNAEGPIGYVYSLIWRKRVYVIQTGLKLSEDKRLMPGYVAHVLALAHNKKKGMKVYDLMHGDSLYKGILCNQTQTLYWLVLQRRRLKYSLENFAVGAVRMCRRAGRDQRI
ncbi:MAG: GNAT family N-acetyltransferase [Gammaproteobacteria bacterium]|nr:GNAT family N-acetyltransferase [Gammaproteobacteria bacterium]